MIYYFASINEESFVDAVHLIDEQYCLDDDGLFNEEKAIEYLNNFHGESKWVQASIEQEFRYNFPSAGFYYYEEYDAFVAPRPDGDYVLHEDFQWRIVDIREFLDSVEI